MEWKRADQITHKPYALPIMLFPTVPAHFMENLSNSNKLYFSKGQLLAIKIHLKHAMQNINLRSTQELLKVNVNKENRDAAPQSHGIDLLDYAFITICLSLTKKKCGLQSPS